MLITQAEFSRLAGVSRSAVKQAINNKLITAVLEQNGKVLINKNEGLAQYKANSRRQRAPKQSKPAAAAQAAPEVNDSTGLEMLSWGQSVTAARAATPAPPPPQQQPPPPPPSDGPPPDYAESRARSEFEKANLLELERKTKEGLLLQREEVERSQAMAINISKTRLLGVPSTAKQRIPHLTLDEVEILTGLIREALEELAGWEVTT